MDTEILPIPKEIDKSLYWFYFNNNQLLCLSILKSFYNIKDKVMELCNLL